MNTERDKFLTEAMGICIHTFDIDPIYHMATCCKCGITTSNQVYRPINFSTWEGFGKLWNWLQKQEWRLSFMTDSVNGWSYALDDDLVNPDKFANAVYEYLKEK